MFEVFEAEKEHETHPGVFKLSKADILSKAWGRSQRTETSSLFSRLFGDAGLHNIHVQLWDFEPVRQREHRQYDGYFESLRRRKNIECEHRHSKLSKAEPIQREGKEPENRTWDAPISVLRYLSQLTENMCQSRQGLKSPGQKKKHGPQTLLFELLEADLAWRKNKESENRT